MRDSEDSEAEASRGATDGGRGAVVSLNARRSAPAPQAVSNVGAPAGAGQVVSFDRRELNQILQLYGRKVAAGEWRDYALDFTKKRAVFSIFRRSSEAPLFRIEKDPELRHKQGAYCVVAATGAVLRRGQDLARVIAVLDKPLRVI